MATTAPATAPAVPPQVPFTVAAHLNSRQAFQINAALGAAPVTPAGTPVPLTAVGFVVGVRMEVSCTCSGGTPAFLADGPFNVFQTVQVKNAGGQNLIYSINGYALMVINKFGGQGAGIVAPTKESADPRANRQYSAVAATGFHFFLDLPFDIDRSSGLGAIPALASNKAYQIEIVLSPILGVWSATTPPTVANVTIDASVIYWDEPVSITQGGVTQGTAPWGIDLASDQVTTSMWLSEFPAISAGTQTPKLVNVGAIIRNIIFILRNASGARDDTVWPAIFEQYIDTFLRLRLKKTEWQDAMCRWYNLQAASFDVANGLEQGVYVLPYHVMAGGDAGSPENSRAQLLWTEDTTTLQHKFADFQAGATTLQILVEQISTPNAAYVFNQ
jgi:hypothetical protein